MDQQRAACRNLVVLLFTLVCAAAGIAGGSQPLAAPLVAAFEDVRQADFGPRAEVAAPANAVRIGRGEDIRSAMRAHPPGTTFLLEAGTHRGQVVRLRPGDALIGEPGATLDGSEVVRGFARDGETWAASVGPAAEPSTSFGCVDSVTTCNLPELLFVDGELQTRVGAIEDLAPGAWFLDSERGALHLTEDPSGRVVELSRPFGSSPVRGGEGAVLRNLRIVKYALDANEVAVRTAPGMLIERNDISFNGGIGLALDDDVVVRRNRIAFNGQYGMAAANTRNALVERNEIAFNNSRGFSFGFNGGGTKFARTRGLTLRDNYVHGNLGAGLWTDVQNVDVLVEGNVVADNGTHGIFHEIGGAALIRGNVVADNGRHGIYISSSSDVRVTENLLAGNRSGLVARTNCRRNGNNDLRVENVEFYGNTVYQSGSDDIWVWGKAASLSIAPQCDAWDEEYIRAYFNDRGNAFYLNTYYLSDGADFVWNNQQIDYRLWQQLGQDWDGTITLEERP